MGTKYLQSVAKCDEMESVSYDFCASMERLFLLLVSLHHIQFICIHIGKRGGEKCTKDVQKALLVTRNKGLNLFLF